MYTKHSTLWAQVDDEGRLILPPEALERFGIEAGGRLRLEMETNDIYLHRPVTHLAKVYIEPTNRCNLECRTCMRFNLDEPVGLMSEDTFDSILRSIGELSQPPTLFFGGIGEPLAHPQTIEWIRRAKEQGCKVQLFTIYRYILLHFCHKSLKIAFL